MPTNLRCALGLVAVLAGAAPAVAQSSLRLGDDVFAAGETVAIVEPGLDDVFATGNRVRIEAALGGTAHLLGRLIVVNAGAASLYAAGMEVLVEGPIDGDATVAGYTVRLGPVGGDLRASGATVTLGGPVAGAALVAGDEVRIDGAIGGDLHVMARDLVFGPEARVGGRLTLIEADDAGARAVPPWVVPGERLRRLRSAPGDAAPEGMAPGRPDRPDSALGGALASGLGAFLTGVAIITLIAAAIAALLPARLAALRHIVLAQPLRAVWIGAITQSALTGAVVVAGLTLIGLLAAPAFLLAAGVMGFLGYVIGAYAFGVALLNRAGRALPDSFGDRALAALTGALAAGVLALIPFAGWLFVLALSMAGVGAIVIAWQAPPAPAAAA